MDDTVAGDPPQKQPRLKYPPFVNAKVYAEELREIEASREKRGANAEPIGIWLERSGLQEWLSGERTGAPPANELDRMATKGRRTGASPADQSDQVAVAEGRTDLPATDEEGRAAERSEPPFGEPTGSMELTGFALSGGGIRSASVCLGVLQAFALRGKLRLFDYMSTVSGGGFIGSSWSSLLSSDRNVSSRPDFPFVFADDVPKAAGAAAVAGFESGAEAQGAEEAERSRRESGLEPAALERLRDFANYLIPRGLSDQVRVPALLLRGILINLVIVFPYVVMLALASVLYYYLSEYVCSMATGGRPSHPFRLTMFAALTTLAALLVITAYQSNLRWRGKSDWATRNRLLSFGAQVFLVLLTLAWLDLQTLAVPLLSRLHAGDISWLPSKDVASAVSGLLGVLSAVTAGGAVTAASPFVRKLAFALLAILAPVALWFLYANAFIWIDGGGWACWAVLGSAFVAWCWAYLSVDINATSLHSFYRDKLSNAFMMRMAQGKPVHSDDVLLSEIAPSRTGGPYHLVNATANSPHLNERAQRGRRAESFVLSPLYCGNGGRLGYCPTKDLEAADRHMNLATAMAISGAAAAPNAGQQSPGPLITFTLAMLNVRLGYWCRIPGSIDPAEASPKTIRASGPKAYLEKRCPTTVGPVYFLLELLGLPHVLKAPFVNLTDGGHLDNLGVLELLRRRCRYVVAIDAEADPNMTFNGLAVAQRFALVDLGVKIKIDVSDIRRDAASGLSRRHWALGTIDYGNGEVGELLYIKSSVTGSEIQYVSEYRARNPGFPHESTGDQFFDEAQFEAYRALGEKIGATLLESRYAGAHQEAPGVVAQPGSRVDDTAGGFFAGLREWLRPAAPFYEAFLQLQRERRAVEAKLRTPEFAAYAAELYPEIRVAASGPNGPPAGTAATNAREMALLQVVNEQMQLMERVVLALQLDDAANQAQPRNRGWLNLFRRWSQAPTFRRYWTASIADYSDSLQSFCQHVLGLRAELAWREADEKSFTALEHATIRKATSRRRMRVRCLQAYLFPDSRPQSASTAATEDAFPVAVAAFEEDRDGAVLRAFRVRDTYRSLRLGEILLERLKPELSSMDGSPPRYDLGSGHNEAVERVERLLYRAGFVRVTNAPTEGVGAVNRRDPGA